MTIKIPALKDRTGDALVLAKSFLSRFAAEHGTGVKGFDASATAAIEAYAWPGNVRELESRIKRAVIMADGSQVSAEDLELEDVTAGSQKDLPLNLRQVREPRSVRPSSARWPMPMTTSRRRPICWA